MKILKRCCCAFVYRGRADAATFKSKWIIHFINEQGLDEAGVDEQGLFREFVEVSCQKIFDPDMNLFARTEEQRMYPCSESQLGGSVSQEHLNLFHLGAAPSTAFAANVPSHVDACHSKPVALNDLGSPDHPDPCPLVDINVACHSNMHGCCLSLNKR